MSSYSEAKRLAKMCVDDEGNPPASYASELAQYIGLAQVCATLAVADELRRRNDQVESFQREVLGVLEKITSEGPSGDGATAQEPESAGKRCMVCGREATKYRVCLSGDLTREQWFKHHDDFYRQSQEMGANKVNAAYWADEQMESRFGPCPDPVAGPSQQEGEDR